MPPETKSLRTAGWVQTIAIGRRPDRTLFRLAVLVGLAIVAFFIFDYILLPIQIHGPSMVPTYRDGQYNFINRLAYLNHEPQRGDVVAIRFSGKDVMYVKRIVGLPGESVSFKGGSCCINGKPLDEPYLKLPCQEWESPPRHLGPEEYYVVGDNRSMPFDSHEKGGAERRRIIGKILFHGNS